MARHQAGPIAISSSSKYTSRSTQLDMNYYLTTGLKGVESQEYCGIPSFSKAINALHDEFDSGNWSTGQYLVFVSVTQEHLVDIHRLRDRHYKWLCIMYLKREEVLVVKIIPSVVTEMTQLEFGLMLFMKTMQMGLGDTLYGIGRATFEGLIGQKEADSTFKPLCRLMAANWPTVVFECGLSQSLERLRVDSRWWLENTTEVKIVILFSISEADKAIHLEQWEMLTPPNPPRTHVTSSTSLIRTNEVDIVAGVASGAPLTLDFQKVFLRRPVLGEGDIVFSAQELESWAAHVWAATP